MSQNHGDQTHHGIQGSWHVSLASSETAGHSYFYVLFALSTLCFWTLVNIGWSFFSTYPLVEIAENGKRWSNLKGKASTRW